MSSQFELNEFAELLGDTKPADFRIGKVISIQGTTLTLGVPNGQGGLFSIANVNYLNNFVPTAGATCWYRNINGSILVFGQQESVADGPRTKLVTLLGAQSSWAQGDTKTLLRSISNTTLIVTRWQTPFGVYDCTSLTGSFLNRLSVTATSSGTSASHASYVGELQFTSTTAILNKTASYNTANGVKTYPDTSIYPYQIYALL